MFDPAIVIAVPAAAGAFFLGLAVARVRRRRILAAGHAGVSACLCLLIAAFGISLALNLYTYRRLSYEQPVAQLAFRQTGPQRYRATLTVHGSASPRTVVLEGDQWQLDARVLKWRPLANLLGFDALCRLDRISGRYSSIDQENHAAHTAHALATHEPGLSAWQLARSTARWAPLVDARYGSATYMPMANGAAYTVSLTQSGLIARPANAAARAAMRRWPG